MPNDFTKFILQSEPCEPSLPLTHSTDGLNFRSIFRDGSDLKPTQCPVFKEDLLYLFYGRPAYRIGADGVPNSYAPYPVCFLLKPDCINIAKRVYPFDSGAFANNLFESFVYKKFLLESFLVEPNSDAPGQISIPDMPARIVSAFFKNNYNYYWGKNSQLVKIHPMDMEADTYNKLIKTEGKLNFDDRRGTIEIQVEETIPLSKNTVYAVILPQAFMDDKNVQKMICTWDAELLTYHTYLTDPSNFTAVIIEKVGDFLIKKGLISAENGGN